MDKNERRRKSTLWRRGERMMIKRERELGHPLRGFIEFAPEMWESRGEMVPLRKSRPLILIISGAEI